jgi:hypothetical protein
MSMLRVPFLWDGSCEEWEPAAPGEASQMASLEGGDGRWNPDGYAMRLVRHSQSGHRKQSERRSFRSRLYRGSLKPMNALRVIVGGCSSWGLVIMAAPVPTDTEAATYWRFLVAVIAAVGGLLAIITGSFMLGAKFVAEPAAARLLKQHVEQGASAHEALVSRKEWDEKHDRLVEEVQELAKEVAALVGELKKKRA